MPQENDDEKKVKGIQTSINTIIGADTSLRRKRKTAEDLQKEQFVNIIHDIENISARSHLTKELNLDLSKYDEGFYEVIDDMFALMFGEKLTAVILWYLYERMADDGSITDLIDENDKPIPLKDANELWIYIKSGMQSKTK